MRFRRSVVAGIVAIGVVAFAGKTADAGNVHTEETPPTTDFQTVVTEPGRGGGRSGSDHPAPVCVWVRGGRTEIDALARNSGPAAPIIRESADDNILLVYRCDGAWDGRTYRWLVPVTATDLARDGLVELSGRLPAPEPRTTPAAGQPSIAGVPVFVWTDAGAWTSIEVTRTDPLTGLSATATATPTAMRFDPGDGAASSECDGPGVAYDPMLHGGDASAQAGLPGRCSHVYSSITRNVDGSSVAGRPVAWPARLSVTWTVSWVATNGQSGRFAPITKTTAFERPVTEVQVLVTG